MQPAAAGFVIIMLGAIRLKAVQMHRGFSADGGWELDLVLLAAALALVVLARARSHSTGCCSDSESFIPSRGASFMTT